MRGPRRPSPSALVWPPPARRFAGARPPPWPCSPSAARGRGREVAARVARVECGGPTLRRWLSVYRRWSAPRSSRTRGHRPARTRAALRTRTLRAARGLVANAGVRRVTQAALGTSLGVRPRRPRGGPHVRSSSGRRSPSAGPRGACSLHALLSNPRGGAPLALPLWVEDRIRLSAPAGHRRSHRRLRGDEGAARRRGGWLLA